MRYNTIQLFTYASLALTSLAMPLYARDLGASTAFIGLIGAGYGLSTFVSNVVFGRAGDRFDRRLLLLCAFLASAFTGLLQYLAHTPTMFLAARFFFGLTIGMIAPTLSAYVYDVKRPLGKFTSYNALGWLLASLVMVAIGEAGQSDVAPKYFGSLDGLFLLSVGFCLIGFVLSFGLKPMKLGLKVPLFPRELLSRNLHVYLSVFIRHFGAASIWVIYPLYILELGGSIALVGWVHIVNMVFQVLVYRNVEQVRRLASSQTLISIGLVLSALTFLSFTFAHNAWQLLPLQAPLGVSFSCLWLGSMKEILEHNEERATATGLLNASMNLSNVAGPLVGGVIAAALGFRATMYFAGAVTVVSWILFLVLKRPRETAPPAPPLETSGPASTVAP
jgi:MFS family permease